MAWLQHMMHKRGLTSMPSVIADVDGDLEARRGITSNASVLLKLQWV